MTQIHRRPREVGLADLGDQRCVTYFTQWNGGPHGNYPGCAVNWSGPDHPVYFDYGDGSIGKRLGSGSWSPGQTWYEDGSIKRIRLYCPSGWDNITIISSSWAHIVGPLPDLSFIPNLQESFWDNNDGITGTCPNMSHNTALTKFWTPEAVLTGPMCDFSACTNLLELNMGGGDHSIGMSGTIPSFAACTNLRYFNARQNLFTGVSAGSFTTQTNLTDINLWNCSMNNAAINALLDQCITSLGLGGRVSCTVNIDGDTMGVGDAGKIATLSGAGWSIWHN
jgi:hypothetical protein